MHTLYKIYFLLFSTQPYSVKATSADGVNWTGEKVHYLELVGYLVTSHSI